MTGYKELTVLGAQRDPFRLDTPANHRLGEWLAATASGLGLGDRKIHLRGLHYMMIGQPKLARIGQAWRDGWLAGQQDGYRSGREDEAAERDQAWDAIARPIARGGQAHADLERTRWTVRGEQRTRETVSQPHPDDHPGREADT